VSLDNAVRLAGHFEEGTSIDVTHGHLVPGDYGSWRLLAAELTGAGYYGSAMDRGLGLPLAGHSTSSAGGQLGGQAARLLSPHAKSGTI